MEIHITRRHGRTLSRRLDIALQMRGCNGPHGSDLRDRNQIRSQQPRYVISTLCCVQQRSADAHGDAYDGGRNDRARNLRRAEMADSERLINKALVTFQPSERQFLPVITELL